MRIVAFVPAKSHSERIPNKNLAILDGEHLFKRKIRQLQAVSAINEVYLDTDSDEIALRSADLGVRRLSRPAALASNQTDGHELFAFECEAVPEADIYIQALCTAPFMDENTIGRALHALIEHPTATSLVAVSRRKQYTWGSDGADYGEGRIPNSVDLPVTVVEGMSLYIVRRAPGNPPPRRRYTADPLLFEIGPREDIDVNVASDIALAEEICGGQRAARNLSLKLLKMHLSSPILADICKEMGVGHVLAQRVRHIVGGKLLGVAKTLRLRALEEPSRHRRNDEWKGIYDALDSYRFIRPGDVIMVATSIPEKAYFGDLNAHLAMRSGAEGAVIDGFTRDTDEVRRLGFPVFALGSYCDDIKYEGTMESMNTPIEIGGCPVSNGDFVFADADGVVVIPKAAWAAVQDEAWSSMHREAQIRLSVLQGKPIDQILQRHGTF